LGLSLILIAATNAACAWQDSSPAAPGKSRVVPEYDTFSGRVIVLSADQNGDGQVDQWTYLEGNRPLRGEGDTDGDGRIDRWEYFDGDARLIEVGSSSLNDGVEDTWTWVAPTKGEARIDRSQRRDRQIDRREFYTGETLVRVEEDMNGDGMTDKWERYDGGRLVEASFDTTLSSGRPDRRVAYDAAGGVVTIEVDPERDGTFVRMPIVSARDKGEAR
jgi:hypothetical protein